MRQLLDVTPIATESSDATSASALQRRTYEEVLVMGQPMPLALLRLAPSQAVSVRLDVQGEVEVSALETKQLVTLGVSLPLTQIPERVYLLARTFSDELRDRVLEVTFLNVNNREITSYKLLLTVLQICLDVDANRDGIVDEDNPHKADWKWGTDGYGAILLVNSDQDIDYSDDKQDLDDYRINGLLDFKDFSFLVIRRIGPRDLPSGCELRLSVNRETSRRIRIFDELDRSSGRELIGPGRRDATIRDTEQDLVLAVEGLHYPDRDFDGLVKIALTLSCEHEQVYTDQVMFRVAPWIMTPNNLAPKTVYICRLEDQSNRKLIEELRKIVGQAEAQLEVVPPSSHQGDRWMQDEIEIGYTQAPGKLMYVVLDSPRNRGLDEFPEERLLGPNFGWVTRESRERANKLDSFGNLEVSPPVRVNGVDYPLGRIIFGGTRPEIAEDRRRMMKVVRDFLYAQQIQAPIEVFSDWLSVGHIDEFMTFVPASTAKGFKLILTSADQSYEILKQLESDGYGKAILREGKYFSRGTKADITVSEVLDDKTLARQNRRFQEFINWNREVLKQELGLTEGDIIDLPALFEEDREGRAETFSPDMVNMIVLGKHLVIPKPYGPMIKGECQFEAYVKRVLEPLGLICHFLDDWEPYFRGRGEVHCGTNTRRVPFAQNWWDAFV
ncbi:MAG: protein-arginine deiminase [Symploca sp. SIO3C6]|nr:protein-arginine deiminase [Symploca sp. SIO3C6]